LDTSGLAEELQPLVKIRRSPMSVPKNVSRHKWIVATVKQPCPVCQKTKWCSIRTDGRKFVCRTEGKGGVKRVDKSGVPFWVHRLDAGQIRRGHDTENEASTDLPPVDRAPVEVLHQVYQQLLDNLHLSQEHQTNLQKRGLQSEAIATRGYRSMGRGLASAVQKMLHANAALEQHLTSVPGFVQKQDDDGNCFWKVIARQGIGIPIRDVQGQIRAIVVRMDQEDEGKYRFVSSQSCGSGAPIHVPLFSGNTSVVRITEGALKADIATELSGILTIGLPGAAASPEAAPVLEALKAKTAVLAFDADASNNRRVAKALKQLAKILSEKGLAVELETWALEDGKGIDDVFARGKTPKRLQGDEVWPAIDEIVKASRDATEADEDQPLLDPGDPHRLATSFLDNSAKIFAETEHDDGDEAPQVLRYWRQEWFAWDGAAYRAIPSEDLRCLFCGFIKDEFNRLNVDELHDYVPEPPQEGKKPKPPPCSRKVTTTLVNNTLQALGDLCLLPSGIEAPRWLSDNEPFPAHETLVAANGLVHLPSLAAGKPAMLPPTTEFFSTVALDYDFDREAALPVQWLTFLNQIWPEDQKSIDTLQEWFGLCLLPDTRYQKMLMLVGPRRSGKGTISRVLERLVGTANYAGPTLSSLGTDFGLAPLLGKSLAIIPDARLSGSENNAMLTERLLAITGEDTLTVNRKHLTPVTTKLPTRLMLVSNELPRLTDASQAIMSRIILLRMITSWHGKEDKDLLERLLTELPGILHWSIAGWQRLQARGAFQQPPSSEELLDEMQGLVSPVGSFVYECCRTGINETVPVADLFQRWRKWCTEKGHSQPGTQQDFGKKLRATEPQIRLIRPRQDGSQKSVYCGIGLNAAK
jgi:putative DNA primase/helicase